MSELKFKAAMTALCLAFGAFSGWYWYSIGTRDLAAARTELRACRDSLRVEGATAQPDTFYYNAWATPTDTAYLTVEPVIRYAPWPPPAPLAIAGVCPEDSSVHYIRVDRQGRVVVSP